MTVDITEVLATVRQLSVSELLTVQEVITQELWQKTSALPDNHSSANTSSQPTLHLDIPGVEKFRHLDVDAELARIFTPERLEAAKKADLGNLRPGSKSVTEMINEDREERT